MLEALKQEVFSANLEMVEKGLVIYTWGNVSGISSDRKYMVIKPSGVNYETMRPGDMSVVELGSGIMVEGEYKPSSDTPTHLELYRRHPEIRGITHTHSIWAVAFAQAGIDIPVLGTTHADYFFGKIPCTRAMTEEEVTTDYEANTGLVINETIGDAEPLKIPGIVVRSHGPFTWGKTPIDSVRNSVILETVAEMAFKTILLNPDISECPKFILDKHYQRKHGKNAYYGQDKGERF